jgi:hypothetical protein
MNNNKKCIDCKYYSKCKDGFASWIFFITGIVAAIAIRAVALLAHLGSLYGKISWYVGVGGFLIFFLYKYRILKKRSFEIKRQNILEKLKDKKELNNEDYELIEGILCSLTSSKERINYLFIFCLSALALAIAVYVDFIK